MAVLKPGAGSRVAVLGGTGWVGRHVCAEFSRSGCSVVAIARNRAPHISPYGFHAIDLAAATTGRMAELLRAERVDVVVNTIDAINTTDGWVSTDERLALVNVVMVRRLLAAIGTLRRPVRLVHLGSILEYGPVPAGAAIVETWPARPDNSYARSKLDGSSAVLAAARRGLVDGVVLRLVNVTGPHPAPDTFPGKLVGMLAAAGAAGEVSVTVSDALRDFLDVRDVARAVVAAAGRAGGGRVINVGSGVAVPIGEMVRTFFTEAGLPPARLRLLPRTIRGFGGEWTQADITLARRLLHWGPQVSLRQSLRDMAGPNRPVPAR